MDKKQHQIFAELYPKFLAGKKWLDERIASGQAVATETDDFTEKVIWPLCKIWDSCSVKDKAFLKCLMKTVERFDGAKLRFTPAPEQQKLFK